MCIRDRSWVNTPYRPRSESVKCVSLKKYCYSQYQLVDVIIIIVISFCRMSDLETTVLQMLMDFVYQLLCSGDLTMAKALRVKILEKYNMKRLQNANNMLLPSQNVYTRYFFKNI